MNKLIYISAGLLLISTPSFAQKGKVTKTATTQEEYKKTSGGLLYKIVTDVPGDKTAKVGDQMEMHIHVQYKDSVLFDSRVMNKGVPVPLPINPPTFHADLVEGLMLLSAGDSAHFRLPVDSIIASKQQVMPFMQAGNYIDYKIKVVSVKDPAMLKKEQEEKAAAQIGVDEKTLQDYFKANNIKPLKTASGLYYTIATPGIGDNPKAGEEISVNYTGRTVDGKPFDSNIDPQFKHVEPFKFKVGQHQVIAGWDEGLMLFKKGGKGTLYIPSRMAYGERGAGDAIAPNSVLIFDVELVAIGDTSNPYPLEVNKAKDTKEKSKK